MKKKLSQIVEMIKNGEFDSYEKEIADYYQLMTYKKFMPNTPVLVNFGNPLGMGMACFVLDMEDSIESIMETLKKAALIFKAGGGCGYNFSKLRPKGDYISTTYGKSSGPIAFMTLYDKMTDVIKQGGVRRGANMGILNS
ncbi:MAG: ribonucleotide reductase N-terminal alpha domain-containing protein [Persephonella sp.]|nr:ribonucleotide reductase N-terminal alpha domain-containing protein [Persephonella sp.]